MPAIFPAPAGVSVNGSIPWASSLATGLGIGAAAVASRRMGERNADAPDHAGIQALLLGVLLSRYSPLSLDGVGWVPASVFNSLAMAYRFHRRVEAGESVGRGQRLSAQA